MSPTRRFTVTLCAFVLLLAGRTTVAHAQFTILTVSGSPAAFTVSAAVAGSQPTALSSALTYFIKSKHPAGAQKISAQLDSPMPAGTTLTLQMVPPSGATSLGAVSLDATVRDIIVNIDKENGSTYGMTYTFSATVAAGVVPSQSRTVTLTMSSYP
jgi:hypothetical protein